jgi:hypothetical protein
MAAPKEATLSSASCMAVFGYRRNSRHLEKGFSSLQAEVMQTLPPHLFHIAVRVYFL